MGALRESTPHHTSLVLPGRRGEQMCGTFSIAPIVTDFVVRGVFGLLVITHCVERAAA